MQELCFCEHLPRIQLIRIVTIPLKTGLAPITATCYLRGKQPLRQMAKQSGPIKIVGTVQELTFYQSGGNYYVRQKSTLDAKRIKTDPVFANTRKENDLLALASPTASRVYQKLKPNSMVHHYRKLTAEARRLYCQGLKEKAVTRRLFEYAAKEWGLKKVVRK